jgi:HK97 family phage prohead protease
MSNKRERRFLQSDVSVETGVAPKISGYCAVFGKKSEDLGNFREIIDPCAFDDCLATNPDIVGLFNHSNDMVLGRTTSGTMKMTKDSTGLKYEIDPPDTSYAKDLMVSMKRGDVKSSSFGFFCLSDRWSVDPKTNENIRTVLKADIFDASVVTSPAYTDASSQVRSLFPDDKGVVPEVIVNKISELRAAKRAEKRGKNILAAVAGSKWAILPTKLETICAFLTGWSEGHKSTKEEIQAAMMGFDQEGMSDSYGESSTVEKSPVAVLTMYGTIGQKMTMMTEFSGGFSCEGFTKQFRAALADDSITAIVFDIDSPGGTVTGVPELAAEIRAARGQKPIIAVANGMAASAAYWLASAADKLVVIPSGEVGSIGVYQMHQDVSGALEQAGVKIQFIKAGEFKTEGNPYEPASESFLASQQKDVDAIYVDFKADVAAGRGVTVAKVEADFGNGRMLMAKNALAAGMVDEIATLDQVVAGLVGAAITINTEVPLTEPNEYDFEALVVGSVEMVEAAAGMGAGCGCECAECMAGDHEDCTGDDGLCDWDMEDDGDDYVLVAQGVSFADLTPEDVAAECTTGLPTVRHFKVFGKDANGVDITKSVTKEKFNALLDASAKRADKTVAGDITIDARGSIDPALTEAAVHRAMQQFAPAIGASVKAANERRSRKPHSADRTNEEIAASYLAKVAESEANDVATFKAKLMEMFSS